MPLASLTTTPLTSFPSTNLPKTASVMFVQVDKAISRFIKTVYHYCDIWHTLQIGEDVGDVVTTYIFRGCLAGDITSTKTAPPELTSPLPVPVVADTPQVIRPSNIFYRIDTEESHLD